MQLYAYALQGVHLYNPIYLIVSKVLLERFLSNPFIAFM